MPKAAFGTSKYLDNRMKSKGLQKLRWYCQPCEKQCRDENGFKCHCMSESHKRQLLLFAENSEKFLSQYSQTFLSAFTRLLSRRFGTKRVLANRVYQEYISDKEHLHMNATRWGGLSDFVKYLGREGIARIDETEKGWYIQWIDRSPGALAREDQLMRMERSGFEEEERDRKLLNEQIAKAHLLSSSLNTESRIDAFEKKEGEPVVFKLPLSTGAPVAFGVNVQKLPIIGDDDEADDHGESVDGAEKYPPQECPANGKRKIDTSDLVCASKKPKRVDHWLTVGIIVKVLTKELAGGRYNGKKGHILNVVEKYGARLRMIDSADIILVDQADCETVIPNIGGSVLVVNGHYRGQEGCVRKINEQSFSADITLVGTGKTVEVPYEDFSKYID